MSAEAAGMASLPALAAPWAAIVVPDVTERVRVTFTMKRVDGGWKIADRLSAPVR